MKKQGTNVDITDIAGSEKFNHENKKVSVEIDMAYEGVEVSYCDVKDIDIKKESFINSSNPNLFQGTNKMFTNIVESSSAADIHMILVQSTVKKGF